MILIHALNLCEARELAARNGLQPREGARGEWHYVHDAMRMQGCDRGTEMWLGSGWQLHPNSERIMEQARVREFRVVNMCKL